MKYSQLKPDYPAIFAESSGFVDIEETRAIVMQAAG
jgi:hypothetical protein